MKRIRNLFSGLLVILMAVTLVGCDTFEDIFENEKETQGIVEALTDNTLTVDGIEYTVTSNTEYEGITGLADLQVGDEVEVEYEEKNGGREAVEVELAGADDD